MSNGLRLGFTIVAVLACGGVERRRPEQPSPVVVAPSASLVASIDAGVEPLDAPIVDAVGDAFASEPTPDVLRRCAELDPTPASCAASHPGRSFAHCRWTVGPVHACGRGAPPPSARALVCICNGCLSNRDCATSQREATGAFPGDYLAGNACMELGYPCGPLARVCVNVHRYMDRDEGAYHDDHGHLHFGDPRNYAGRTPALRAPCTP